MKFLQHLVTLEIQKHLQYVLSKFLKAFAVQSFTLHREFTLHNTIRILRLDNKHFITAISQLSSIVVSLGLLKGDWLQKLLRLKAAVLLISASEI